MTTAYKHLVQKFDNLTMRDITAKHPYEFLSTNFPTYDDFYNYYIELSDSDTLFEIYHDLRYIPIAVSGMEHGIKPGNIQKIYSSMRKLTELTQQKYIQANTSLAQNYSTKQ